MSRYVILVILFTTLSTPIFAQSHADSLRSRIDAFEKKGDLDSEYLTATNDLAKELLYSAPDECIVLGEKALKRARDQRLQ